MGKIFTSVIRCTAAMAVCSGLLTSAWAQKPFAVKKRIVVGGEGTWDYMKVDTRANRLYIAHLTRVEVVDLASGKPMGAVTGLTRCHSIVISEDGKTGYISDGFGNQVVVFDTATLAVTEKIATGKNPDGLLYEASTGTLWAFNGQSKSATVIDEATHKVVATVELPAKPEFPVTDSEGTIYLNSEDNSLLKIDAKSRAIAAKWPLKGCDGPSGLAFDKAGKRLFSVCDGKAMAITDAATGKSLGVAKIGTGPDAAGYDAKDDLAFASNEDGTLSVVDASKPGYPTIQTLPTMNGARTMTFDPTTGTIYTVSAKLGAMPKPTPGIAHTRRLAIPGTFVVLVIAR